MAYVVELAGEMIPLEVKAGRAGALKSLHQFMAEKHAPLAVRFDASPANVQDVDTEVRSKHGTRRVRYRLLSLPLYLVERLPDLVAAELASV